VSDRLAVGVPDDIAARDLVGAPRRRHSRREFLWLGVTADPDAEWLARQLTEACGWNEPPRCIVRDWAKSRARSFMAKARNA
jgi:hypothetical protein